MEKIGIFGINIGVMEKIGINVGTLEKIRAQNRSKLTQFLFNDPLPFSGKRPQYEGFSWSCNFSHRLLRTTVWLLQCNSSSDSLCIYLILQHLCNTSSSL